MRLYWQIWYENDQKMQTNDPSKAVRVHVDVYENSPSRTSLFTGTDFTRSFDVEEDFEFGSSDIYRRRMLNDLVDSTLQEYATSDVIQISFNKAGLEGRDFTE